jgi:tRNA modification GTPase
LVENLDEVNHEIVKLKLNYPDKNVLTVVNKVDLLEDHELMVIKERLGNVLLLSAKKGEGIEELKTNLLSFIDKGVIGGGGTIISNTRHYDALIRALQEVQKIQMGLNDGISGDLLAIDIRQALNYLGEITGEITSDELLGNIFANFCIGK